MKVLKLSQDRGNQGRMGLKDSSKSSYFAFTATLEPNHIPTYHNIK